MTLTTASPQSLDRDLRTLALFIQLYCRYQHAKSHKQVVSIPTHDVTAIAGKPIVVCPECAKLLTHAFVKRSCCPMDPKPMCKHCPNHCYHPKYRQQIREVMKYSGKAMLLRGRLDYLFHLLF
jgi:hypothetical protein